MEGLSTQQPPEGVVACAPWQFLYYVHYQGYNRRYDRWVMIDELLPAILDPKTQRVSNVAVARLLISAMHSLGHPTWRQYVASIGSLAAASSSSLLVVPDPHAVFEVKSGEEPIVGVPYHNLCTLLAIRLLCSIPYQWTLGYEASRSRRDASLLIDWCATFLHCLAQEGPEVRTREERALMWITQLLFSRFQLDGLRLHAAAMRASKKKRRTGTSLTAGLGTGSTSNTSDAEGVWAPLCASWSTIVETLEHCRGISNVQLNEKSRSLSTTWETTVLPSRLAAKREDGLKSSIAQSLIVVLGAATRLIVAHRSGSFIMTPDNPLIFPRNFSSISAFDDVQSDAGEHEGIDNTSVEVALYTTFLKKSLFYLPNSVLLRLTRL